MKKSLINLLIPLMFLISGCNKDELAVYYDVNGDGNLEAIWEKGSSDGYIIYTTENGLDIDTIYNFGRIRPSIWSFKYENKDKYPDLYFVRPKEGGSQEYLVLSKEGRLLGEEAKEANND
jgi:hypothetical protein